MNCIKRLALLVMFATFGVSYATAGDTQSPKSSASQPPKAQTHCPVMGGEIDSTTYTDIQGQRVYHCCPACTTKLIANPDLYFKKAAAQGILFENIQTTDPVTGQTLAEKKIFTDYDGRRIFFVSEANKMKFLAAPQAYLKKMEVKTAADAKGK